MLRTKTYTEQELVEGLIAHEEQAYAHLYDHYAKALFTVIFQAIQQQEESEEVLQEVFVKIWQNINAYDPSKGRIFTWMITIARNHAIDRVRNKGFNYRRQTRELGRSVTEETPGLDKGPKDVGLLRTIDKLPDESRKLLELAYFEGYTQDEISKMMGIPLGTVKTRIRTTIIHLRKILQNNPL